MPRVSVNGDDEIMKTKLLAAVAGIALLGLSPAASAGVITFDEPGLNNGDDLASETDLSISSSSVTYNVSVSGANAGTALVFDTTDGANPADPDLFEPFTGVGGPLDPDNILVIGNDQATSGNVNDDPDGGTIEFVFSEAVELLGFRLFDTGDSNSTGVQVEIDGSVAAGGPFGGGLSDNEFGEFSLAGTATTVSFTFDGSGGIDNIAFDEIGEEQEMPEPATLALVGAGLIGGGLMARRRRKA
jgi:hypothetical protein